MAEPIIFIQPDDSTIGHANTDPDEVAEAAESSEES